MPFPNVSTTPWRPSCRASGSQQPKRMLLPTWRRSKESTVRGRGLRLVGTESWKRNVAILGYWSEKRRFFSTKTSSETRKTEQRLRWSLQMRTDQGECEERWERRDISFGPKPRKWIAAKLSTSPIAHVSCFLFQLSVPTRCKPQREWSTALIPADRDQETELIRRMI